MKPKNSTHESEGIRVLSVAEARESLSRQLQAFRRDPDGVSPVLLGTHRRPEAVLLPVSQYDKIHTHADDVLTLDNVRRLRIVLEQLAAANNIESDSLRVFGSVSRGEASANSDLDLIVTPRTGATLSDFARFEIGLEALFGCEVDVVSSHSLDVERDAGILRESIAV
ncbi:nucleotidyltransferase domain-containing protein [Pseudoclavibacter soli]|uniref:nucleotidyltransferase domain-containing protein n=1 Tax=Pseudoclavibacter soli TaxID=452623 RepID=UPI00068540E9|nr:nucleotidyltransferase domain-containing protein [Pseudoclavibacter soli]